MNYFFNNFIGKKLRDARDPAMNILLLIMALLVVPVIAEDTPINIGITGGMSMAGINGSMMEAV